MHVRMHTCCGRLFPFPGSQTFGNCLWVLAMTSGLLLTLTFLLHIPQDEKAHAGDDLQQTVEGNGHSIAVRNHGLVDLVQHLKAENSQSVNQLIH